MKTTLVWALAFVALANGIHGESDGVSTSNPGEKKQICTPGSRSKVECNTCTCSNDGTALGCTRMACPKIPAEYLNPDGSIKRPDEVDHSSPRNAQAADRVCEPNSVREWDCNTCRCSPDGTTELCTRAVCPDHLRKRRDQMRCIPNEHFMDDCNSCRCSPDGRSAACTLMFCLPNFPKSDGSVKAPHQSSPLLRSKRDQVCIPNSSRVWECNNCRCSPDGTAEICTRRVCPAVPRVRRDEPFRCEPNSTFQQDCNTCFCSPDGRSAGCTLKGCISSNYFPLQISEPKTTTPTPE